MYYFFNFTWGVLMTGLGIFVSEVFILLGYMPKLHKKAWYFLIPGNWGGITLGMCIFVCNEEAWLISHEYGHTVQNAVYGPFMVLIGLASLIRCTYRKYTTKILKTPYDSIWFEKQATKWGNEL